MLGTQGRGRGRFDALGAFLAAAVGVIAVDGLAQRLLGAEAGLGAGHLQGLQGIGLGQGHFTVGEGGLAGHLTQQAQHLAGMRFQGIGIEGDGVVGGGGADAAAHALGRLGDGARIALGRAFIEQAGQQLGAARRGRGVGAVAGAAQGQHEVHARQALARQHPDFQAVGQGLFADLGHGDGLVLAVLGQFGRQLDGLGGAGGQRQGQQSGEHQGSELELFHDDEGLRLAFRAWRRWQRLGRRPGRPTWRLACGQ